MPRASPVHRPAGRFATTGLALLLAALLLLSAGVACRRAAARPATPSPVPASPTRPPTTVRFVALDGDDTRGDGSRGRPFRTIRAALRGAGPGTAVYVRGGVYPAVMERVVARGTVEQPIVIRPFGDEQVIFDGVGGPAGEDDSIVLISQSSHVVVDGFEVRNSAGRGVSVYESDHVAVRHLRVHHIAYRAIGGGGHHLLIEDNVVWQSALVNEGGRLGESGWPAAISTARRADGGLTTAVTLRRNEIYDIWGEGIIALFADGVTIDGNRIYDTFGVKIYVDTARNVLVTDNTLYATTDAFNRPGRDAPSPGVGLATEFYPDAPAVALDNVRIEHNWLRGNGRGVSYWHDRRNTQPTNSYARVVIRCNVLEATRGHPFYFAPTLGAAAPPRDNVLADNVVEPGAGGETTFGADPAAWSVAGNVWSGDASIPDSCDRF